MRLRPVGTDVDINDQRDIQCVHTVHFPSNHPGDVFHFVFRHIQNQFVMHLKDHSGFQNRLLDIAMDRDHF